MPKRKRSGTSTESQDANILSSMQSADCKVCSNWQSLILLVYQEVHLNFQSRSTYCDYKRKWSKN